MQPSPMVETRKSEEPSCRRVRDVVARGPVAGVIVVIPPMRPSYQRAASNRRRIIPRLPGCALRRFTVRKDELMTRIQSAYDAAKARYAEAGVDTDAALKRLAGVPISLHCWQGDDVEGFEKFGTGLGGGLAATGNYPGKARTPDDLRADASLALSLIPGRHRFNLHASYGEFGGRTVDRNEIGPRALRRLDRLGEDAGDRARFQPDVLLASESGGQLHAVASRSRRSARSGSITASRAGASAPRWARRSASRASRTSGSRTA